MARRIIEASLDYHVEQRTLTRSFDTLEAAQQFAKGKDVRDIYRAHGRFKVEWIKNKRVDYRKRIYFDGEEITPETAMKWFCWHEIVAAMEKQPKAIHTVADQMQSVNASDWEYRFLIRFLETATQDIEIR